MLRQLSSRQLAEMYAYWNVENSPDEAADPVKKQSAEIAALFQNAALANRKKK
jgi:hypothetical protein